MSISITSLKTGVASIESALPDRLRVGTSVAIIALLCAGLWYGLYLAAAFVFG